MSCMQTNNFDQTETAKLIGVNVSILNQWLQDKYTGNVQKVNDLAQRFLDMREKQEQQPVIPIFKFVATYTAEKIHAVMTYAQTQGKIGVVYGMAGCGKTTAAEYYASMSPNVWHITMNPTSATANNALDEICVQLGISDVTAPAKMRRAILHKVRNTSGLLVIDEAQHLSLPALEVIRSIHDETGIGVVFMGNETVNARFTGGRRQAEFAQLFSRVAKRLYLQGSTAKDIGSLADAWGITDKSSRKLLGDIGKKAGALRNLMQTLQQAYKVCDGQPSESDIKYAWNNLGGGIETVGGAS